MNIVETLKARNPELIHTVSRITGMNEAELERVLIEVAPAISTGVKTATKNKEKAHQLFDLVERDDVTLRNYLETPREQNAEEVKREGESILSIIFGDRAISRKVAEKVAEKTDVQEADIKNSLPYIATAIIGVFNQLYNKKGLQGQAFDADNKLNANLNSLLCEFFDADKDGSVLDDFMGMLTKLFSKGETKH